MLQYLASFVEVDSLLTFRQRLVVAMVDTKTWLRCLVLVTILTAPTCSSVSRYEHDANDAGTESDSDQNTENDADEETSCRSTFHCTDWTLSFGDLEQDVATGVTAGDEGSINVTGFFRQTLNLGETTWTAIGEDGFIASYNTQGDFRWARQVGGDDNQRILDVAIDRSSNVYVTGNPLLLCYSSDGVLRWESPSRLENGFGQSIAIDQGGVIYIGGGFNGDIDLGGGNVTSVDDDFFVVSYSNEGSYLHSIVLGGEGHEDIEGIAVDNAGSIYVTGGYQLGELDLGGTPCPNASQPNIFVASLGSEDLDHQWTRCFGGSDFDYSRGIDVDHEGNIYITGSFSDSVDFDEEVLSSEGYSDAFVASFNSNGGIRWARGFGGIDIDEGRGIVVDGSRILVTGVFRDTVDFGGVILSSEGDRDIFITAFSVDGELLFAQNISGTGQDVGASITADDCGNIFVAGSFQESIFFGDTTLMSAGEQDIIILGLCE